MKIMKRLMRYLLPYKHYLLLAILSAILSVTASLYAPIIICLLYTSDAADE